MGSCDSLSAAPSSSFETRDIETVSGPVTFSPNKTEAHCDNFAATLRLNCDNIAALIRTFRDDKAFVPMYNNAVIKSRQ